MKITRRYLRKIIQEEVTQLLKEGAPHEIRMGISSGEFERYSPRDDVGTAEDAAMLQDRMDMLDNKYHVVDAENELPGFIKYVQKREETPNGGEAVVLLRTIEDRSGARTAYFKTAHSNHYGRMRVEA